MVSITIAYFVMFGTENTLHGLNPFVNSIQCFLDKKTLINFLTFVFVFNLEQPYMRDVQKVKSTVDVTFADEPKTLVKNGSASLKPFYRHLQMTEHSAYCDTYGEFEEDLDDLHRPEGVSH